MVLPPPAGRTRRQALQAALAATLAGTLAATLPGSVRAQPSAATKPPPEPALPELGTLLAVPEVLLLDGSRHTRADAQGRVLVLYWWASWCPFCTLQSPHIDALWRQQQARGLRVLGLSIDRRAEDASRYLAQRGYGFPSAWVTPALAQALPKPPGLPVTVVLGRDGRVRAAESGQLFPEDIEQFARFL